MELVRKILFFLMVILSIGIAGYAFSFFAIYDPNNIVHVRFMENPWIGFSHVYGGAVALLTGCFQFSSWLRRKYLNLHRWLGKIYLLAILVGGLGGFFAAIDASGTQMSKVGFTILDILWICSSVIAYRKILQRDIPGHRDWMIRSFALTWAAVMLRWQLPLFIGYYEMSFVGAYSIVAWSCWIPNLLVAEYIVRRVKMLPA